MGKRLNPYLAKIHWSYSLGEAADLLGVHKNTVREWIKHGLPVINERRPFLILGADLRDYLLKRQNKRKRPCPSGTIYCVRCREPKIPFAKLLDYRQITDTKGDLTGLCPDCESDIHQFVSLNKLEQIKQYFDVSMPQVGKHISGCS